MKEYSCNVVQDLLPLYEDGCCSEDSRRIVDAHLAVCVNCRSVTEKNRAATSVSLKQETLETPPVQTLKQGMRKLRKAWIISLVAIVLVISLGTGILYHIYGSGPKVDNLDEIVLANAFWEALQQGNYEKAYSYYAIDAIRKEWTDTFFDEKLLVDLETDGLEKFLECTAPLQEAGLSDYQFREAVIHGGGYILYYTITVGQQKYDTQISFQNGKIRYAGGGSGSLADPDPLDLLRLWSHYLWEDYNEQSQEKDK